jgi:predicted NUDIX family NTP pyrophosphohydrolase
MAERRVRISAGILLYRRRGLNVEVLLGHPGGPYFDKRDDGVWSIPKGEAEEGEQLWLVAKREFGEETGHVIGSGARAIELGSVTQRGGKVVHAWAVEGELDPTQAWSNTFSMEWPPHSGIHIEVPELDRVAWFVPELARVAVNPAQAELIDRLITELAVIMAAEAAAAQAAAAADAIDAAETEADPGTDRDQAPGP